MLAANDDVTRQVLELEANARQLGFRLAVQCLTCKRWLTAPRSVAAHRGPVCRGGHDV
ncbi:MAG: DUF6011 domain-containing protein [Gordonia sp. (in: high G+C Gram-positive bacteria)]|uniref:DUF6011 domain-containing protein n=1 Tax=Gordonia sp. (in: high G+C Gram-positive bacteria) TaxID=84139 RepID=UPI003C75B873